MLMMTELSQAPPRTRARSRSPRSSIFAHLFCISPRCKYLTTVFRINTQMHTIKDDSHGYFLIHGSHDVYSRRRAERKPTQFTVSSTVNINEAVRFETIYLGNVEG